MGNWRAQNIRISNESPCGELRGPGVLRANQESSFARARRSGNCKASGARRAGQGRAAAKRTLDAPKRSEKSGTGATANQDAIPSKLEPQRLREPPAAAKLFLPV